VKVHITESLIITGKKDGRVWLKLSWISPSGEAGSGMMLLAGHEAPTIDITQAELVNFTSHGVEFDQRGRLVGLTNQMPLL
jgi:hypothetical protein